MVYAGLKKVLTMSSLRKLEAARANGALGRGRKTPAGLARSAQNAYRHGLLASCVLLPDEMREDFEELHRQFRDRFLPVDGVEDGLIEEMVSSFWRMRRACAMETNLLTYNIQEQGDNDRAMRPANAFTQLSATPDFNLLHRYEARLQRMFQRAMDNLMRLRDDDRREEAWTEENQPLQEVREAPDPVSEQPVATPIPPEPSPETIDNPLTSNDLSVAPTLLKPVLPNRPVQSEQKLPSEANRSSGDPSETVQIGKAQVVRSRKRPKTPRGGRF